LASTELSSPKLTTRRPRNGVARNISYLVGGQLTTWTLAATWTVVVPRQIGPTGMGQLVTMWASTGILIMVLGLGTRVLVVTEIARDPASVSRHVAAAIAARLILFIPGAALMAAYVHLAHFDQYQVLLLVVATASMPFALANEVFQAAFQGLERMQYLAYLDVIYKTVLTAGSIVLVLLGFHVLSLVLLGAGATVLVFGTSLHWARRHFDLHWRVEPGDVWRLAIASLPFWATTMFLTFYMWIDSVMLALLASPREVGWYGVSTKLFATLLFIPVIIGTATLARLTATHKSGLDAFRRELTPIVESTLVISLPIAAGTIVVAGPLVALLYGPAFGESAPVLSILGLVIPATYLNIIVNQALVASGRQIAWTKVMAVSAVLNPLLNWIAIPAAHAAWQDAALGAAWSLVATEALMLGAGLYLLRGYIDPAAVWRVTKAGLAALTMGLAVYLARRYGLVLQVALGLVLFGALAFPLGLVRPQELALGRQLAGRVRSRLVRPRAA
jgi:Membrane protein involved in the export of O-antigen and teichoic acid